MLDLPLPKLRTWVRGVTDNEMRRFPVGLFSTRSEGRDRNFDFYTLIELFSVAELRRLGVSMRTLRSARIELGQRYNVPHPLALQGLLTDGKRLLKELGKQSLLELGSGGQAAFESVIKPFCHRLDFDATSQLAARFFPLGRDAGVVVDPRHSFGRPVITGTNVATETIASLAHGGESLDDIASEFQLDRTQVEAAWQYEHRHAA
jgi:uncharacterized protein (DUF433 family)